MKVIQPLFETWEVIFENAEAEMRQSLSTTFDNGAPAVTMAMRVNVDSVAARPQFKSKFAVERFGELHVRHNEIEAIK